MARNRVWYGGKQYSVLIRNIGSHFRRVWMDGQSSEMDLQEI